MRPNIRTSLTTATPHMHPGELTLIRTGIGQGRWHNIRSMNTPTTYASWRAMATWF